MLNARKKETGMLHCRITIVMELQVLFFPIRHKDKSFVRMSWRIDVRKNMSIFLNITLILVKDFLG